MHGCRGSRYKHCIQRIFSRFTVDVSKALDGAGKLALVKNNVIVQLLGNSSATQDAEMGGTWCLFSRQQKLYGCKRLQSVNEHAFALFSASAFPFG